MNHIEIVVTGVGPTGLTLHCVDKGCRAFVFINAPALDATEITTTGVQVLSLGLMVGPLTSWEHLQGFGIPEEEIAIRAPQDLELLRQWRAWLDDNGFAGTLCMYEVYGPGEECVEVTAAEP